MTQMLSSGEQNLQMLQSLVPESDKNYIWCYSTEKQLVGTSCPDDKKDMLDYMFRYFGGADKIAETSKQSLNRSPFLIGSPIGLQWAAVYDHFRSNRMIIVIGPVFFSAPVEKSLHAAIYAYSDKVKNGLYISQFIQSASQLPVMSYAIFSRYVVLVNNILNGEQLALSDLHAWNIDAVSAGAEPAGMRNRTEVYHAEKALLSMVRNGDINYQEAFQRSSMLSPGVQMRGKDPLRQAKTSIIVFTSLVCRAAMEGGLSPETAYSLGDSYIQSVEDCRDSAELSALAHAMYHDFIYRVHQIHVDPNYSHAIQKCCDFIELSLDKKIRASDLASLVGYTEYYLTEKFKKETGVSLSSYIRNARIKRAKVLLEATDLTVAGIAEKLAFNTPNYFIQCFREATGQTPAEYRSTKLHDPVRDGSDEDNKQ